MAALSPETPFNHSVQLVKQSWIIVDAWMVMWDYAGGEKEKESETAKISETRWTGKIHRCCRGSQAWKRICSRRNAFAERQVRWSPHSLLMRKTGHVKLFSWRFYPKQLTTNPPRSNLGPFSCGRIVCYLLAHCSSAWMDPTVQYLLNTIPVHGWTP